jgi:hypothetical protein
MSVAAVWRRRGLRELALVAIIYAAYDASRFFVEGRQSLAVSNARSLLHLEKALGISGEKTLNLALSAHSAPAVIADYLYATTHYLVTPVVLVWLWRRHRAAYATARTTLAVATVLGLVGFSLLPVAPPRMLPGFVDTMARYAGDGWWGVDASAPRGTGHLTNEFAAMPSLHVGWALWCGWQVVRWSRASVVRALGIAYPVVTTVVVVGTANHYLLDAVAGVAVVAVAALAVRIARWRPVRVIDLTEVPRQKAYRAADATAATTRDESVVMPRTPMSSR